VVTQAKGQPPEGVNEWLERELRETRARLHKVESELEQSLKRAWSVEADLKRLAESVSNAGSAAALVGAFREDIRQVRDQLGRIQDRQAAIANRTEEAVRQRTAEGGREKHDLSSVSRQLDALARAVEQYDNRLQAIEEGIRRAEDDLSGAKLAAQGLERIVEESSTRAMRSLETATRLEQQVAAGAIDIGELRKSDESLGDRLNLILEQVHRSADRIEKLDDLLGFPEEARELIHRATSERELMSQRMALIEKLAGELAERAQTLGHSFGKVEQRQHVLNAQIMDLSGQVQGTAEMMQAQMKRLSQLLLRQRRRQLDTLGAEIKELSQGELHSEQ